MRRMHPENRFTHRQQGRPINQFGPSVHGEKLSRSKRYTELEVCSNGMCTGATARSKSDKPQLRAFTRRKCIQKAGIDRLAIERMIRGCVKALAPRKNEEFARAPNMTILECILGPF